MPLRLLVIDGGDRGQSFRLPEVGTIRIGNYGGHTDICLHDLYVAKDHRPRRSRGRRQGDRHRPGVRSRHARQRRRKSRSRKSKLEDIIRIGNSYLKLIEADDAFPMPTSPPSRSRSSARVDDGQRDASRSSDRSTCGNWSAIRWRITPSARLSLRVRSVQFFAPTTTKPNSTSRSKSCRRISRQRRRGAALRRGDAEIPRAQSSGPGHASRRRQGGAVRLGGVGAGRGRKPGARRFAIRARIAKASGGRRCGPLATPRARSNSLHRKHLVHGSVTPANVLLARRRGRPALKDAGLWDALAGSAAPLRRRAETHARRAALPVARAHRSGNDRGRPLGSIFSRRRDLRTAHRPAAVRGRAPAKRSS